MPVFIKNPDPDDSLEEIIEVRDEGELRAIVRHTARGIRISVFSHSFVIETEWS
jgi:hypothetical protein